MCYTCYKLKGLFQIHIKKAIEAQKKIHIAEVRNPKTGLE